jgi:hypothetical protein
MRLKTEISLLLELIKMIFIGQGKDYFTKPGFDALLGNDYYPEGHQSGLTFILNGHRIAANGDVRLEACPGQWSPVPRLLNRRIDPAVPAISLDLVYPDDEKNCKGFNCISYPDLHFNYTVRLTAQDDSVILRVYLYNPVPDEWSGKISFNLELFPGEFFGRSYVMIDSHNPESYQTGIFPDQPNGPGRFGPDGYYMLEPLAIGTSVYLGPENSEDSLLISSKHGGKLEILDGRAVHNNGWFILRSVISNDSWTGKNMPDETEESSGKVVLEWEIKAFSQPDFLLEPVIQINQVGFHPLQEKRVLIELDARDSNLHPVELWKVIPGSAPKKILSGGTDAGYFLRYRYLSLNFTEINSSGIYFFRYADLQSSIFQISDKIWERHVWQPVLEYFLPIQMCHMRVEDGYRVWHGACHMDDALMAPVNHNHFDGYFQGPSTLCSYKPGEKVPGLNKGGWHDAGDFDLMIESQAKTVYGLSICHEAFDVQYDNTMIDQEIGLVRLRCPDGIPDILQQIEHGLLSIVGSYRSLGRPYKGIVETNLEDYVLIGDPLNQKKERWVFTNENFEYDALTSSSLAAASRVMRDYKPDLSNECRFIAKDIWDELYKISEDKRILIRPAVELLLADFDCTGSKDPVSINKYGSFIFSQSQVIISEFDDYGDIIGRILPYLEKQWPEELSVWKPELIKAAKQYSISLNKEEKENPYGLPYKPDIWGAGWTIQRFAVKQYWLAKCYPDIFDYKLLTRAFDFILGCHPGSNNTSFVSGVGSKSIKTAYGINRADWSYIPGGVVSGTGLIRPDIVELLEWPYLWQQSEYMIGGAVTDWLFMALAVKALYENKK